jgi:hypothetical protein
MHLPWPHYNCQCNSYVETHCFSQPGLTLRAQRLYIAVQTRLFHRTASCICAQREDALIKL